MDFIIGHKRETDFGRLEKRQSGNFRVSERWINGLVFGKAKKDEEKGSATKWSSDGLLNTQHGSCGFHGGLSSQ